MLAVRCQFLQGTYQAAEPGAPAQAEWPPHPGRLHAALVAAGWSLSGEQFADEQLRALSWLESLDPPSLALPDGHPRTAPTVYVPRNLSPSESRSIGAHLRAGRATAAGRESGRVDRVFPTTVIGDQPVWFIWTDAAIPSDVRKPLTLLVESVQYLGSSRSPVACAVSKDPPLATLSPSRGGTGRGLRVATPGVTESLIATRSVPTINRLMATAVYAPPGAQTAPPPAAGPFLPPLVLRRTGGFGLTVAHTGLLASAFRRATLANAGDGAPAVLHGHGRNPHAAFVPLPNVGHPHSSGEILGFALVLPEDSEPDDRDLSIAAAAAVAELRFNRDAEPWSLAVDHRPNLKTLQPATWVGPSTMWRTATPIVLDRHPRKSRGESVESMLRLSFTNAGYPEPTKIRASHHPFLSGAIAGIAQANDQLKKPGTPVHAEVVFDEPVRGPMLVGRGRYIGVGLLKPARSGATR